MELIDHKFDLESKGLRVSVYGNLLMIILGISFAITTGSHAILLVLIMIPIPIKMLGGSVREVLQASSADGVEQTLRENVERVVEPLNLQTVDIRMLKTGRYFYVMIYLVLKTETSGMTVLELDQIREKIISALPPCGGRLIIDVVFTTQDKWLLEQQSLSQTDFTVSS